MLTTILSALAALSAALCIGADLLHRRRWIYLFKPLTMLWVILIVLLPPHGQEEVYRALILAGLLCSLIGDVLLMLPRERFIAGLGAFLLAHVLYTAAFTYQMPIGPWFWALPFILCLAFATRLLWPHLQGGIKWAVLCYEIAILIMAWRAWVRFGTNGAAIALFAACGAICFVASDLALAYNRFVRPWNRAAIAVLGPYFVAQWLLALSV